MALKECVAQLQYKWVAQAAELILNLLVKTIYRIYITNPIRLQNVVKLRYLNTAFQFQHVNKVGVATKNEIGQIVQVRQLHFLRTFNSQMLIKQHSS